MEQSTDKEGVIRFIGYEPNDESQAIYSEGKPVSPIFYDRLEVDGDTIFDE